VDPRNHVLEWGRDYPTGMGNFRGTFAGPMKSIETMRCYGVLCVDVAYLQLSVCSRHSSAVQMGAANCNGPHGVETLP